MESLKRNYVSQSKMNDSNSMDDVKSGVILCYLKVCLLIGERLLTTQEKSLYLNEVARGLEVVLKYIELCDSSQKFKDFLSWVKKYKNTSDKAVKANINQDISKIKNEFFGSFRTPAGEKLDRALAKLSNAGQVDLFKETNIDELRVLRKKAEEAREAFNKSKDDPVFKDSMEWRIEFPEVLDENGDFTGWDIVIANPPYIFARNQSFDEYTKGYYLSHYTVDEYQANTYTLFMELGYNLLKAGGTFAYIVPNNMLTIQSNQKIRNFLISKTGQLEIINSMDKLFTDANVDNCLVFGRL